MNEEELKKRQHSSLKSLHEKIKEVADERPLDSGDEEEEEIWNAVEELAEMLNDFLKKADLSAGRG